MKLLSPKLAVLAMMLGLFLEGNSQCIIQSNETAWFNDDVRVEAPYVPGRTYQWWTNDLLCTITPDPPPYNYRAWLHRPPTQQGGYWLKITDPGCSDSLHFNANTPGYNTYLPAVGPSTICGNEPMQYVCTWLQGVGNASCYGHHLIVDGGTILTWTQTNLPNYYVQDSYLISWGSGPVGTIRSFAYHCTFPMSTEWTQQVTINCGFDGDHYPCLGTPSSYKQACASGSTYSWSCNQGTILNGQGTDSVEIQWNALVLDTVVCIFNSTTCGLDTNYFPVSVTPYPTNTILGDTTACAFAGDTFSTALLPPLNPPTFGNQWQITGGGLNILSTSLDSIFYTHGSGPIETIILTTNNHNCIFRDTMEVTILPGPAVSLPQSPVVCNGDSVLLDAGPGFATYAWSNGSSLSSIYGTQAVPYTVSVTGGLYGCQSTATSTPVMDFDCVWPGDANHDYIADAIDFLDIGVAFGDTGAMRPNASIGWVGQPASNWVTSFLSGENHKHADCDGNGLVDFPDTIAVNLYQGFTHIRTGGTNSGSAIPLRIRPRIVPFAGQDSVELIVELGDQLLSADSVYGLTYRLNYDQADVFPGVTGRVSSSFLGTIGPTYMAMDQTSPSANGFIQAMVRTDHHSVNGFGEIARIKLQARPSVWASQLRAYLPLGISNIRLIRASGEEVPVSAIIDSVFLYDLGYVGFNDSNLDPLASITVSPNPSNGEFQVTIPSVNFGRYALEICDLAGHPILNHEGQSGSDGTPFMMKIDLLGMPAGLYIMTFRTRQGIHHERLTILGH